MFSRSLVFLCAALVAFLALASSVNAYDDRTLWKYPGHETVPQICKKIHAKCEKYKNAHPKGSGWYLGNTCQPSDFHKKNEILLTCESVKSNKAGKRLAKVDHIKEIVKAFHLKHASD